jgi:hypothetical protein
VIRRVRPVTVPPSLSDSGPLRVPTSASAVPLSEPIDPANARPSHALERAVSSAPLVALSIGGQGPVERIDDQLLGSVHHRMVIRFKLRADGKIQQLCLLSYRKVERADAAVAQDCFELIRNTVGKRVYIDVGEAAVPRVTLPFPCRAEPSRRDQVVGLRLCAAMANVVTAVEITTPGTRRRAGSGRELLWPTPRLGRTRRSVPRGGPRGVRSRPRRGSGTLHVRRWGP